MVGVTEITRSEDTGKASLTPSVILSPHLEMSFKCQNTVTMKVGMQKGNGGGSTKDEGSREIRREERAVSRERERTKMR